MIKGVKVSAVATGLILLLFTSCKREEVEYFDSSITTAADYKIDPVSNDTFFRVFMPSAFTPNADGVNDIYLLYGQGWMNGSYSMRILSREGNLIFSSNDPRMGFDGTSAAGSNYAAQQVFNVDVQVSDTTGEAHRYLYKIACLY